MVPQKKLIFEQTGIVSAAIRPQYIQHEFIVPGGLSDLFVELDYENLGSNTLYVSTYDGQSFRGNQMKPGKKGAVHLEIRLGIAESGPGGIPGPIGPGVWRAQIDVADVKSDQTYSLRVYGSAAEQTGEPFRLVLTDPVLSREARYYKGELHSHTIESDGKFSVQDVVAEAERLQLDFLAITDHITTSQWVRMQALETHTMALLHSCEVTSRHGHANLHGIHRWVDVYTDREGWDMNRVADDVNSQGGLFCVNHAFSGGRLGYRSFYFDWHKADLMEIYHNLEGCNNQPMLSYWDHLMLRGYRIVGVGGTDSHDPFTGNHKLGQCLTYVHTDELSEKGILRGLVGGNVYVSKGAQLRFTARDARGQIYQMGQEVLTDEPILLNIQAQCDEPLIAFIMRDGLMYDHRVLDENKTDWQTWELSVPGAGAHFYRIELHAAHAESHDPCFKAILWRDHISMRAYSNPIFIQNKD